MPKVSIYLPDSLYQAAREHNLPLSSVSQHAIEEALAGVSTREWVAAVRSRATRHHGVVDTSSLLDATRDEFGQ